MIEREDKGKPCSVMARVIQIKMTNDISREHLFSSQNKDQCLPEIGEKWQGS